MKTDNSVADKQKLTDEQIGKLYKKTNEVVRRINDGTLSFEDSLEVMQKIVIEGESRPHLDVVLGKAEIIYHKWHEESGIIYFSVTSDGATGEQWITRLENKGFRVSDSARDRLLSGDFKVTRGLTMEIAVLKGILFAGYDRVTKKIRSEAASKNFVTPDAEVACLIREMFTDQEIEAMGLSGIVAMHEPIKVSDGGPKLLGTNRNWLSTDYGTSDFEWPRGSGFAFVIPQIKLSYPSPKWIEKKGVIYFYVMSDGATGEQWITRLENKGFRLGDYAKSVLLSKDFRPTSGITTEMAVLKGSLFADKDRITQEIRMEAAHRKLITPNAEVACLIREMFTDQEIEAMGLSWIIIMHKPIKDSGGDFALLDVNRDGAGNCLSTSYHKSGNLLIKRDGFAFAVS